MRLLHESYKVQCGLKALVNTIITILLEVLKMIEIINYGWALVLVTWEIAHVLQKDSIQKEFKEMFVSLSDLSACLCWWSAR